MFHHPPNSSNTDRPSHLHRSRVPIAPRRTGCNTWGIHPPEFPSHSSSRPLSTTTLRRPFPSLNQDGAHSQHNPQSNLPVEAYGLADAKSRVAQRSPQPDRCQETILPATTEGQTAHTAEEATIAITPCPSSSWQQCIARSLGPQANGPFSAAHSVRIAETNLKEFSEVSAPTYAAAGSVSACIACATNLTPSAAHTRFTVSNRGALSGRSALYNASRVIPALFAISVMPRARAMSPSAEANKDASLASKISVK
jgi:hypothetical protein